jgi:proteic killer suppression protein
MILSFGNRATEDIFHGVRSKQARQIPTTLWKTIARKLDALNAAHELKDLSAPPANRLEKLKGDLCDFYSIRINDQYRIIFKWLHGHANDVQVVDYH